VSEQSGTVSSPDGAAASGPSPIHAEGVQAGEGRRRHERRPEASEPSNTVRPYGDTTGDGMVQLSFTLPVPHGPLAEGAAAQLAGRMGIDPAMVVHARAIGPDHTFVIIYGRVNHLVDLSAVTVVERDYPLLTPGEVNAVVRAGLRRKLVVIGACIGTDAHTVGIDAILNIKGFAGEKGLEYYRELRVLNLGAQVPVPDLVARARAERADAVLVSQVVTQRDAHLLGTREMSAAFREAYPAGMVPLLVAGGPRFDPGAAADLGVDRVFGRGTTPGEVASYLVHALVPDRR
jgi:beta-lysine 5,6-aminomutase beta subunit